MSVDLPTPPLPEPTQSTFLHLRKRPLWEASAPKLLRERLLLRVAQHVEVHVHVAHAVERRDGLPNGVLEVGAHGAAGRGERDRHVDDPVRADLDRAHHVELHDRAPELGVDHRPQRVQDVVFAHGPIVANARGTPTVSSTGAAACARTRGRRGGIAPPRRLREERVLLSTGESCAGRLTAPVSPHRSGEASAIARPR